MRNDTFDADIRRAQDVFKGFYIGAFGQRVEDIVLVHGGFLFSDGLMIASKYKF
ncbi:hypothetical protein l11_02600 [Neisseria weaveri LMG 5135]|nr:hypothetical protein l13_10430 [Neisseria weaveri ATCC 51223]EGV38813.1 hypothetical protein l11_02600 [Neisseria weaveri LMG 5135]